MNFAAQTVSRASAGAATAASESRGGRCNRERRDGRGAGAGGGRGRDVDRRCGPAAARTGESADRGRRRVDPRPVAELRRGRRRRPSGVALPAHPPDRHLAGQRARQHPGVRGGGRGRSPGPRPRLVDRGLLARARRPAGGRVLADPQLRRPPTAGRRPTSSGCSTSSSGSPAPGWCDSGRPSSSSGVGHVATPAVHGPLRPQPARAPGPGPVLPIRRGCASRPCTPRTWRTPTAGPCAATPEGPSTWRPTPCSTGRRWRRSRGPAGTSPRGGRAAVAAAWHLRLVPAAQPLRPGHGVPVIEPGPGPCRAGLDARATRPRTPSP